MRLKQFYKNHLIKDILRQLGNVEPSKRHFEIAEKLFLRETISYQLSFTNQLTQNEALCLFLAAKGFDARQTAEQMNTTMLTVYSYWKEIKRKLNCSSIAQAVYEGICFGYVSPKRIEGEGPNFRLLDETEK